MMALLALAMAAGQIGGPYRIEFKLERPETQSSYTLRVAEDGTGEYRVRYPAVGRGGAVESAEAPVAMNVGTAKKLFAQIRALGDLHGGCASKAKNIAYTGQKTLTFTGPEDAMVARCAWNYTDDKTLTALQDEFLGLASTLDRGRQMARDQRFDRLGLDKDVAELVDAVKDGRAFGLETIAPVLRGIVDDQSLLERVRLRAGKLLEQSQLSR